MTVRELIEELSKYPQDMDVIKRHNNLITNHKFEEIVVVYEDDCNRIILD